MIKNKMMLCLILFGFIELALAQVDTAWVRRWSSVPISGSDYVYGLTVDANGCVYIAGASDYLGSNPEAITFKYGPAGESLWFSVLPRTGSQMLRSVAVGASGNVYVTGYTMETGNGAYFTVKYRANGDTAWVRLFNQTSGYDFSRKLVLDNQENVYITGYGQASNYQYTYYTVKYDSSGNQLWVRTDSFGGAYAFYPNDLALDNDGNPYLVTKTKHPTQRDNWLVAKYKKETGDTYWVRTYNGPADSTDDARGIAFDNSGNIYVTGTSYGGPTTGFDIVTIKYNSNGDTQWVRRWSNPDTAASDAGYWIKVDGSGNVYVYGTTYSKQPANQDLVVLKYNSSGVLQWAAKYNGPGGYDNVIDKDGQNGMALDLYGYIYITGSSRQLGSTNKNDFVTVKFSPDGDTLWTRRYDYADTFETARSMFVDNLGNVYVTGQSAQPGRGYDIATIKYVQSDFVLRDVSVSKIEFPVLIDSGDIVVPACSVYNNGDSTENYRVRMKIGNFYNDTVRVTNHLPNTYQYLTFPAWNALQRGNQVVSCSTELTLDMIKSNDKKTDTIFIRVLDVGVIKILYPLGTIDSGTVVTPACSVYNYGNQSVSYTVRMKIGNFYNEDTLIENHTPGTFSYLSFPNWTANQIGTHPVACSTELVNDLNNNNDQRTDSVEVIRPVLPPSNWIRMADIPALPSGKKPKSGTCMAALRGKIYLLKATNTQDFLVYTPDGDTGTWTYRIEDTIPFGIKEEGDGKRPKKGSAMTVYNRTRSVYVLRGNNSLGFWRYQVDTLDTVLPGWKKLKNIPLGAKAVKEGSGLVSFRSHGYGYIFAMKGSKTDEFYIYNIEQDSWVRIKSPPIGRSGKIGYRKGSCLAYDGDEFVYVLKGNYGDFYKYSLDSDTWIELRQYDYKIFLNREGKKKKPKDGAALVYYDENCYLLKGGNTREVWRYDIAMDTWVQMDTFWDIPIGSGKRVKAGGTMISSGDYFWAVKGGNTVEFYRHELPDKKLLNSVSVITNQIMNHKENLSDFSITIAPNPAVNLTAIRYILPIAGPVNFKLYNVAGALVKAYNNTTPTKDGVLLLDTKVLPSGVYVLQFNSGDIRVTRKIVIEK
uniref:T9SS type A sorting domain-containing protein n=1 Tax=candidate division WOR-3 bacterium TaxID=2052148 RepID=A0A7C6A9P1_UNCW3